MSIEAATFEQQGLMTRMYQSTALRVAGAALAPFGAVSAIGAESFMAAPAYADSPSETTTTTPDSIHLSAGGETFDSVKAAANVKWLAYESAKGLSHTTISHDQATGGCESFGVGAKAYYPNVPHGADHYINHGRTASGALYAFSDSRPIEACEDSHGIMREISREGHAHNCGNEIETHHKPHETVHHGEVIDVKSLAHKKITLKIHAESHQDASCEIVQPLPGGGHTEVSATGHADAKVDARNVLKLKEFVKTKGAAATKIFASIKDKLTGSTKAEAYVNCEETNTPTPPTPPNAPQANLSLNKVQEVDTDSTNVIQATVSEATVGDTYETCFTADEGRFAVTCLEKVADAVSFTQNDTYTSPSEAGTETVTAVTVDETTGVYANPNPFTEQFPIQVAN